MKRIFSDFDHLHAMLADIGAVKDEQAGRVVLGGFAIDRLQDGVPLRFVEHGTGLLDAYAWIKDLKRWVYLGKWGLCKGMNDDFDTVVRCIAVAVNRPAGPPHSAAGSAPLPPASDTA